MQYGQPPAGAGVIGLVYIILWSLLFGRVQSIHNYLNIKAGEYIALKIKLYGMASQQGKSEGFESCDRPIVRKRPIWVKIGDALSHVTLKFDGWPWKTIGHLSFAVSSFVQHFIAIGEFKLE